MFPGISIKFIPDISYFCKIIHPFITDSLKT